MSVSYQLLLRRIQGMSPRSSFLRWLPWSLGSISDLPNYWATTAMCFSHLGQQLCWTELRQLWSNTAVGPQVGEGCHCPAQPLYSRPPL